MRALLDPYYHRYKSGEPQYGADSIQNGVGIGICKFSGPFKGGKCCLVDEDGNTEPALAERQPTVSVSGTINTIAK